MIHLAVPYATSALLLALGLYGVLVRRNAVLLLMSVELVLNAVNLALLTSGLRLQDAARAGDVTALFVVTLAAAEVGVGLAMVLLLYRRRATVDLDAVTENRESPPVDAAAPERAGTA